MTSQDLPVHLWIVETGIGPVIQDWEFSFEWKCQRTTRVINGWFWFSGFVVPIVNGQFRFESLDYWGFFKMVGTFLSPIEVTGTVSSALPALFRLWKQGKLLKEINRQRIKQAMAELRAKGGYLGGHPPAGYDYKDGKLILKEATGVCPGGEKRRCVPAWGGWRFRPSLISISRGGRSTRSDASLVSPIKLSLVLWTVPCSMPDTTWIETEPLEWSRATHHVPLVNPEPGVG